MSCGYSWNTYNVIFFWQLGKADGYQNEIVKYKEKLNELEFYKTRVDVRIFFCAQNSNNDLEF